MSHPEEWNPENQADAQRDVLAALAALFNDDDTGMLAVLHNANHFSLLSVALGMLVGVLRDHGIDPVEWVREKQAELNG